MKKRITFRNMEHSKVIEDYANQQLVKVEHFLENERTPVFIDLVFEPSHVREHPKITLRVYSPDYNLISSYEHRGVGFYDVLDRVIDVMYVLLHERKEFLIDKRKTVGRHEDFKKQR